MKVLLIPSAILIPKEMRKKFGEIPTVLFPLNGIPIIEHIYQQYQDIVDDIIVISYKKSSVISDYITTKHMKIRLVELSELRDVGYTILQGFQAIGQMDAVDGVFINFADILVYDSCDMLEADTCFFSMEVQNDIWTFYRTDQNSVITDIYDKTEVTDSDNAKNLPFFVGYFYFGHWSLFYEELKQAVFQKKFDWDSFYQALKCFSEKKKFVFQKAIHWFDVGHSENYFKAKTGVQARVFNTIRIDASRGILRKTSQNKEKFIHEIQWYLKMPQQLQYLTPRIYDYSLSWEQPFISMEYYGYNTLHELLLYG